MTSERVSTSSTEEPTLLLRFTGSLMAFGEPLVDHYNRVGDFPGLAMLTGLIANALGWHHREHEQLNVLQQAIRYAALRDRAGQELIDYQTVDLSQPSLVDTAWTTRHRAEERGKGEATTGTHIRYRHYRVDARCYVALTLREMSSLPSLEAIAHAIRYPARPLFLGRKTCLPGAPIFLGLVRAPGLLEALSMALELAQQDALHQEILPSDPARSVMVPEETIMPTASQRQLVIRIDGRDWRHQQHVGERRVWIGRWT